MKVDLIWNDGSQQVIEVLPEGKQQYDARQYLRLDFEPLPSATTDTPVMTLPIVARLTKYFVRTGQVGNDWPIYRETVKPEADPGRVMHAVNHFPITLAEYDELTQGKVTVEELMRRDMPTT